MVVAPVSALAELVEASRARVASASRTLPRSELEGLAAEVDRGGRSFASALTAPGISLIAEFKRSSPSAGAIHERAEVSDVVTAYERGGAAALSVLTEPERFGGSLDDLRAARAASALPILRKDFLVDRYQLLEAAAAGADAVLLIVAALEGSELRELADEARRLGLDCLVEVHDEAELERAIELDAGPIGINNRNLATLEVDTDTTRRLYERIPAGRTVVSESGWRSRAELERLEDLGVDAVLIGEALMRWGDPERGAAELTGGESA